MLAIWSLVPLPFLKPAWTSWSLWFTSCWSLVENFECVRWAQLCGSLSILWHWNENWLFQSCGPSCIFQICWHIECSTFTASSIRIWNSSTDIPSPPLALFVVMLPKAHLTSHSRMFGSRWVITPLWLSGSWRFLLYSSLVYSCHLFLISSASVRSIPFLSFFVPIFAWNIPLVSLIFLKRSLVFQFYCFPLFLCTSNKYFALSISVCFCFII